MSVKRKIREALPTPVVPVALRGYRALRHSELRLLVVLRLQQRAFGRVPDLVHPRLYSEKILWRMLYDRRPLLQVCSDRVAVRDYVEARAGEKYLIPLLGVFQKPEDIPWADLPPPYVVKATHGCDWNIIVRDAAEVDQEGFCRMLNGWLSTNYYHVNWEWSYKHVPRRIIIEHFIGQDGKVPADFKCYCFAGEPRATAVCYDRFAGDTWTWRDPSWNVLTFVSRFYAPGRPTPAPSRLSEMLELARLLSRDFDHIRVDLYCVDDRVYFGELTPTEAAGGWPLSEAGDAWLGQFWELPRQEARARHLWRTWRRGTSPAGVSREMTRKA